jgi:hypothetical protein
MLGRLQVFRVRQSWADTAATARRVVPSPAWPRHRWLMGRPHPAHHVELQSHVYCQLLEHPLRVRLIVEQVGDEAGQGLPVAVAGVLEIAQRHEHVEDGLAFGLFLLWCHAAYLGWTVASVGEVGAGVFPVSHVVS